MKHGRMARYDPATSCFLSICRPTDPGFTPWRPELRFLLRPYHFLITPPADHYQDGALDALCEAFYDYPVMRYVLSDTGGDYDIHLRAMIDSFCENRLGRGQPIYAIRAADQTIAVAVVSSPVRIPDTPELRDLHIRLDRLLGDAAVDRLARYDDLCIAAEPERPHHYLGMLGVRRSYQRQGLSRLLVEHIKNIVRGDETSEGICLNTETEKIYRFMNASDSASYPKPGSMDPMGSIHVVCSGSPNKRMEEKTWIRVVSKTR